MDTMSQMTVQSQQEKRDFKNDKRREQLVRNVQMGKFCPLLSMNTYIEKKNYWMEKSEYRDSDPASASNWSMSSGGSSAPHLETGGLDWVVSKLPSNSHILTPE